MSKITSDREKAPYHHGDLRRALLDAAEAELEAAGIEGFSLRKVAKRAGVSHAAPAHHFGTAAGLLTALAAEGFRRFVATQKRRQATFPGDPESQMVAAGLGYIDFAMDHNALFRLVYSSTRPDHQDPDLDAASSKAFDYLVECIKAITGTSAHSDVAAMMDALAVWAMSHGLADLLSSQQMPPLSELRQERRDDALSAILRRAIPRP